uniref:Sialyltransferase n=1 Tax=Pyramimonas obovata TaxID=1411642 RepID=A0A7S0RXK4_9CHLO|mmetsp:Transcript_9301/g.19171  ORF Transcript_9301/g.19171 Transcript_9301/m.19171 type:complete len:547 (+) Transcript_9301:3-1643(+)
MLLAAFRVATIAVPGSSHRSPVSDVADLKSAEVDPIDLSSQEENTPGTEDQTLTTETKTPATKDLESDSDPSSEKKPSVPPSPQEPETVPAEDLSIEELRAQVAKLREQTAAAEQQKAANAEKLAQLEAQEAKPTDTSSSSQTPPSSSVDWTLPKLTFPPLKLDAFLSKFDKPSTPSSLLRGETPVSSTLGTAQATTSVGGQAGDDTDSDSESGASGSGADGEPKTPAWVRLLKASTDIAINLKAWQRGPGITLDSVASGKVPLSELQNFNFPDAHQAAAAEGERVIQLEAEYLTQLPAEDWRPRYGTCAVVGNSGTLLGKGYGAEIDQHDAVMRINYAPTAGFEGDAGTRTTLDLVNKENTLFLLKGKHKWRDSALLLFEAHSRIIRKNVYHKLFMSFKAGEHEVVLLNPAMVTLSRSVFNSIKGDLEQEVRAALQGKVTDPAKVAKAKQMHAAKLASAPAGAEDTTKENFAFHGKPMSGIVAVYVALQLCDHVDLYGFDPYSDSTSTPYHYFDTRAAMTWVHSFDLAMEIYSQLSQHANVRLRT